MFSPQQANVAAYRIVQELGKSVGQTLVPMGAAPYCLMTAKGSPDLDAIRANLFFLEKALIDEVKTLLEQGAIRQAKEMLCMQYSAFRWYMPPPMWDEFFRILFENESKSRAETAAPTDAPAKRPGPRSETVTVIRKYVKENPVIMDRLFGSRDQRRYAERELYRVVYPDTPLADHQKVPSTFQKSVARIFPNPKRKRRPVRKRPQKRKAV
jgi:hypothetical protein